MRRVRTNHTPSTHSRQRKNTLCTQSKRNETARGGGENEEVDDRYSSRPSTRPPTLILPPANVTPRTVSHADSRRRSGNNSRKIPGDFLALAVIIYIDEKTSISSKKPLFRDLEVRAEGGQRRGRWQGPRGPLYRRPPAGDAGEGVAVRGHAPDTQLQNERNGEKTEPIEPKRNQSNRNGTTRKTTERGQPRTHSLEKVHLCSP